MRGKLSELNDFNDWLGEQPHKHKIIIAGNHDWCFERQKEASIKNNNKCCLFRRSIHRNRRTFVLRFSLATVVSKLGF
jgi:hypothetical protein